MWFKEDERPYIQYYKGHKERISHDEEFGPIVNFLLEYIYFSKKIPRSKWKGIEKDFHRLLDGQPSYKKWHEGSYELWHVIDKEMNVEVNVQANVQEPDPENSELCAVRNSNKNFSRKNTTTQQTSPKMNMGKFAPAQRRTQQNNRNNNNNNNNNYKTRNDRLKNRLSKYKCRHCTKVAGTPKYHRPPFGAGSESQCPYDQKGKSRPGYFFMAVIEGLQINELNLSDDEDDDILFEDEVSSEVSQVDYANQSAADVYQFAS